MALVQPAAGPMSGTLLGAARPGTMGLCRAAARPITYIVSACILNTRHANNIWQCFTMFYPCHSWRRCPARPDGDIRPEAILSTSFGSLRTAIHRQVTCTCQIWISGWILPHFDVRTISVASKLKKLQIFLYYWQKIFDGTKHDNDGERSSGCECYSWRLVIPAHILQHSTVGAHWASILTK